MSQMYNFLPYGFVFQPAELKAMGKAFDEAMLLSPRSDRKSVAAVIFRMAQGGERDAQILCQAALRTQ